MCYIILRGIILPRIVLTMELILYVVIITFWIIQTLTFFRFFGKRVKGDLFSEEGCKMYNLKQCCYNRSNTNNEFSSLNNSWNSSFIWTYSSWIFLDYYLFQVLRNSDGTVCYNNFMNQFCNMNQPNSTEPLDSLSKARSVWTLSLKILSFW